MEETPMTVRRGYCEAKDHMRWFVEQFADYSIEQCLMIGKESSDDHIRALYGMLARAKDFIAKDVKL